MSDWPMTKYQAIDHRRKLLRKAKQDLLDRIGHLLNPDSLTNTNAESRLTPRMTVVLGKTSLEGLATLRWLLEEKHRQALALQHT